MYFDSCVFDTDSLDYLVQKAGVERVMLGSDAPFPIGDPEPLKVFNGAKLTDAQKQMILSDTARKYSACAPTHGRGAEHDSSKDLPQINADTRR